MNAIAMLERCAIHQGGEDGPPNVVLTHWHAWREQETLPDPEARPFNPEDY